MQVVILAGGLATRLKNRTRNLPKSMITVGNRPFLEYQLELLKNAGITEIVLCIGYLGEQIQMYFGDGSKYGIDITYSSEDHPLGTAGALKKAENLLNDVFFTLYGDSYLFLDFSNIMSYFRSHDKSALMTVYRNHDQYDKSNTVINSGLVTKYSKQEKTADMLYIDYGVNVFRKEILQMIPDSEFYPLEDLFIKLIAEQELLAFEVKQRFYEIGSPDGLREFEQYAKEIR
jgi:NDP-sugar pyrophosphorylase family protein